MSNILITTSPQGVDVQNLVGIDTAVTDLRMREKTEVQLLSDADIRKRLVACKRLKKRLTKQKLDKT